MDTVPGGAYQNAQGVWIDAEGKPLDSAQQAEAKKLLAAHTADLDQAERDRISLEAQRNPTAQAIAAALAPKPAMAAEKAPAKS